MKPKRPLFLARRSYRLRRLRDAARLLPLLGAFLMILPMLWGEGGDDIRATGRDAVYLFAVWGCLVVAALGLAIVLRPDVDGGDEDAN
jgi:hypothetical protein